MFGNIIYKHDNKEPRIEYCGTAEDAIKCCNLHSLTVTYCILLII